MSKLSIAPFGPYDITTNYPDLETIGSLWVFYFKYAFFYDYDIQWNESSKS